MMSQELYLKATDKYREPHGDNFDETDRFDQSFYPHREGNDLSKIILGNVQNIQDLIDYFRENKEGILTTLSMGNLVILSNHATWANLPILAYALHEGAGISYENLFIILGPAITLHKNFRKLVRQVANLLKTWPSSIDKKYFRGAGIYVVRSFKNEVRDKVSEKIGKVIFLAVSGTTDKFNKDLKKIEIQKPSEGVVKLIKSMTNKVLYIGVNDLEVFSKKSPEKGDIYFKTSEIKKIPNFVDEIIENVRPLIIDKDSNIIGKLAG